MRAQIRASERFQFSVLTWRQIQCGTHREFVCEELVHRQLAACGEFLFHRCTRQRSTPREKLQPNFEFDVPRFTSALGRWPAQVALRAARWFSAGQFLQAEARLRVKACS